MENGLPSNANNQTGGDNNQGKAKRVLTEMDPIMVDGEYNPLGHAHLEKLRVEQDLNIPDIVQGIGPDNCKFVICRKTLGGKKVELVYHPNPDDELPTGLEWIEISAAQVKNAGRFYKEAANNRIEWFCKRLKGNMIPLLSIYFKDDLVNRTYRDPKTMVEFCKKAALFSRLYPHEDLTTFGCYLIMYMKFIQQIDRTISNVDMYNLLVLIANEMKRNAGVYENEDKKGSKGKTPVEIYKIVRDAKARLTIQQCSKEVHFRLNRIDICAQTATNTLDDLEQLVNEELNRERLETEARMKALADMVAGNGGGNQQKALEYDSSLSRKRAREPLQLKMLDDEDDADGGSEPKRRKIESVDDDADSTADNANAPPNTK